MDKNFTHRSIGQHLKYSTPFNLIVFLICSGYQEDFLVSLPPNAYDISSDVTTVTRYLPVQL